MVEIEFGEPPARALLSTGKPGRYQDWALALRDHPGKWAVLPSDDGEVPRSEKGAANTAASIRRGVVKGFAPKGSYLAVHDQGTVWVKYVGPPEARAPAPQGQEAATGGQGAAEEGQGDPEDPDGPGGGQEASQDPDRPDASVVRHWARTNGFNVPDRGRLPEELWDAYGKALARGHTGLGVRLVPPHQDEDAADG